MKLEALKWWKWSFWVMVVGQGILLYGLWIFATTLNTGGVPRSQLVPWIGTGLGVYLVGRGLQIATRLRERRLAKEAKAKGGA
ncbi:MAG: hypothetical protein RL173_2644 [Fibrobacterota bacterium]